MKLYGPEPGEPTALRSVTDLAGTPVDDVDSRPAGELYGALAEAEGGLIRYLDLSLDEHDRHVLVPIGHARMEEHYGGVRVRLRAARREELAHIPAHEPHREGPNAAHERAVLEAHGRIFSGERYYAHPAYDHSGLYAGEHPIVRADERAGGAARLAPLSTLSGYRLAGNEPDIRGWTVVGSDDGVVGGVRDLLVDAGEEMVRYAITVLEGGTGEVLLPVGYLRVEPAAERVRTPALTAADIEALPLYGPGVPDRERERRLRDAIRERLTGERRYARPAFSPPGSDESDL